MDLLFIENIANVSYNIAKKLREMGYNVFLLTRFNPRAGCLDLANISKEPWVDVFKCNSFFDKTFRYLSKIFSYDVDIIHCHYALEQGMYSIFSRTLRKTKKVICHCHGTDIRDVYNDKKLGWIVKFNLKFADKVFVSTPDLLRPRTELLPNPLDVELFKPVKPVLDLKMNHDFSLFFPSRHVWKHKRQDLFLKALRTLVDDGYDCNLVMIDYGPDVMRSKKLVKELKLDSNVCFIPPIHPKDMALYYNSCDVVWAQMGLGHLGLVSLEAMACDKPVLVDFVYDNAYPDPPPVTKVYSLQDVVTKTKEFLDSRRFNVETRWWIKKYHSYEAVLERLVKTYNELISE